MEMGRCISPGRIVERFLEQVILNYALKEGYDCSGLKEKRVGSRVPFQGELAVQILPHLSVLDSSSPLRSAAGLEPEGPHPIYSQSFQLANDWLVPGSAEDPRTWWGHRGRRLSVKGASKPLNRVAFSPAARASEHSEAQLAVAATRAWSRADVGAAIRTARGLEPCWVPADFYYVAMDFGGHGLSSHYGPGVPYYLQTFVSEIRRVVAGGVVGATFSCTFPEMVDKLILLDAPLFLLESNEMENLLRYKRKAIEHVLRLEASQEPSRTFSLKQLLQRLLKSNSHLSEECGELLLQRGTKKVATGLVLNRDQRLSWVENSIDFISRELYAHSIGKLQAHVLFIKAVHGYFDSRENYSEKKSLPFMIHTMKSTLKERFQFVEVPGNHCVHMSEPQHVASIISSFLQRTHTLPAQLQLWAWNCEDLVLPDSTLGL
ncbi:serine hydrolase-like protein 2 [Symphalangus syndactylus]|uniref:serine hydrolase-like protein 2 n=1 Tax=Symphalangus syndactylus TaxID=9590 RepID=UPI0024421362|nr:serine hydrolase-like protein 2 [Symphalangus syndactylus]